MSVTNCPSCQAPVPPGAIFCDNCGVDLRTVQPVQQQATVVAAPAQGPGGITCPNCGHPNVGGASFCENCGAPIAKQQAQPVPAQTYVPPQPPQVSAGVKCSSCGYMNVQGASFCENCGASLGGQPPVAQGPIPTVAPQGVPGPVVPQPGTVFPTYQGGFVMGRLVIQGSNVSLTLPPGKSEITIGREDPVSGIFPDINLDPHGGMDSGVSRMHAKLAMQGGRLVIISQDTPNGTFLNKVRVSPQSPQPVNQGDELRFGKLAMNYYSS